MSVDANTPHAARELLKLLTGPIATSVIKSHSMHTEHVPNCDIAVSALDVNACA